MGNAQATDTRATPAAWRGQLKYLLAIAALQALLLLAVGAFAGFAVRDAMRARAKLTSERAEYRIEIERLDKLLSGMEEELNKAIATRNEALAAWKLRRDEALAVVPPLWPEPQTLPRSRRRAAQVQRGVGGGE